MSREAMQIALEALESDPITHAGLVSRKQAITALRQALVDADDTSQERVDEKAKDRHEPVAWASSLDFDDDDQEIIPAKDKGKLGTSNCDIPLYTAPQKAEQEPVQPPEWVGLTNKDIDDCYCAARQPDFDIWAFAQEIEEVLKQKNT